MTTRQAPLEMSPEEFRAVGHRLVERIAELLKTLPGRPVTPGEDPAEVRRILEADRGMPHRGADPGALVEHATELLFEHSLPLASGALVKVAPAVERRGIHLGVWREKGELRVWGTTRYVPVFSFVLEVAAPGLLVVKHHRGEVGKFINIAVLEGDQIKVIDEAASSLPDCPSLLTSLLGFDTRKWPGGLNVLVELAVSIRAHGRGGSLLVVPSDSDEWHESIVRPISYAVQPAYGALSDLVRRAPDEQDGSSWKDAFRDAIEAIAGLTAVDGATIINDQYDLIAFGAKILGKMEGPGSTVMHAEMKIGDSIVMLADEQPGMPGQSSRKTPKNAGAE